MIYPTSIQLPNEHPGFASLSSCLLRLLPSTPHPHHLLKLMITNPLSSFPHLHQHVSMPQKETPPSPCAHPCHRRRPNTTPNSVAFLRLVSLSLISSRSGTPPHPSIALLPPNQNRYPPPPPSPLEKETKKKKPCTVPVCVWCVLKLQNSAAAAARGVPRYFLRRCLPQRNKKKKRKKERTTCSQWHLSPVSRTNSQMIKHLTNITYASE